MSSRRVGRVVGVLLSLAGAGFWGCNVVEPGCPEGHAECDGICTDTRRDNTHCGACGNACAAGHVCNGQGACALSCQAGLTKCGGQCTNTKSDNLHCGECDNACPVGTACDGAGECAASCAEGFVSCGGKCTDTSSDVANCGDCGIACLAGQVCDGGTCLVACPEGQIACAGKCVDPKSDAAHCGGCGNVCSEGEVCEGGACVIDCPEGLEGCGGTCVDTKSDDAHCGGCGKACLPGFFCDGNGQCVCPQGESACGNECVDLTSDPLHCNGCGMACNPGEQCSEGSCRITGTVRRVNGELVDVVYRLCGNGNPGSCTAAVAKQSCTGIGYKVVSHASNGTQEVYSLGATTSCNYSTSYFMVAATMPNDACLAGIANLEWSSCCGTSDWHGRTMKFGQANEVFGYVSSSNSGYDPNGPSSPGSTWGCQGKGTAASNYSGCTKHYVACVK